MIRLKVILCILVLSYQSNYAWAQDAKIDSLKALLKTANEDTIKVNILLDLSKRLYSVEPDESIRLGNQANDLAEKSAFKKGVAYALKNIGLAYYTKGKYSETLGYWQQSLKIFEVIGDQIGVSNLLNNIGAIYFNLGNDDQAIEYYLKSLKVSEQLGDKLRIASAMTNIGTVYSNKPATYDQALKYCLPTAARIAAALPGWRITVLELPGIGGSAGLATEDLAAASVSLDEALDACVPSGAPIIACDLAGAIAVRLCQRPTFLVGAGAARAWARRGYRPPPLAPRQDGTHLTGLWAYLRDTHLFEPDEPSQPSRNGEPLPTPRNWMPL